MKRPKVVRAALYEFTVYFALFTVIGTLSHELGHIAVAKVLGYETQLHFGCMSYNCPGFWDHDVVPRDIAECQENIPAKHRLWIKIGGPAQTLLVGMIGLVMVARRSFIRNLRGYTLTDWLSVFFSLFWLREVFNAAHGIVSELIAPNGTWFGGDEVHISKMLGWHPYALSITLGLIGLIVAYYIFFRVVQAHLRFTILAAGIAGSTAGFIGWFYMLGPWLLP